MNVTTEALRHELRDSEYSEGYAESFLNSYVATQIKVLREQRGLKQSDLATLIGTTQTGISRIENVNYSAWNIRTLKKLARAFRVRLRVSFETYGSLLYDVEAFGREALQRVPREEDSSLQDSAPDATPEQPALESLTMIEFRPQGNTEWRTIQALASAPFREMEQPHLGTARDLLERRAIRPWMPMKPQTGMAHGITP